MSEGVGTQPRDSAGSSYSRESVCWGAESRSQRDRQGQSTLDAPWAQGTDLARRDPDGSSEQRQNVIRFAFTGEKMERQTRSNVELC